MTSNSFALIAINFLILPVVSSSLNERNRLVIWVTAASGEVEWGKELIDMSIDMKRLVYNLIRITGLGYAPILLGVIFDNKSTRKSW